MPERPIEPPRYDKFGRPVPETKKRRRWDMDVGVAYLLAFFVALFTFMWWMGTRSVR